MWDKIRLGTLTGTSMIMICTTILGAGFNAPKIIGGGLLIWIASIIWCMWATYSKSRVTTTEMYVYTKDQAEKFYGEKKYIRAVVYGSLFIWVGIGVFTATLILISFFLR